MRLVKPVLWRDTIFACQAFPISEFTVNESLENVNDGVSRLVLQV